MTHHRRTASAVALALGITAIAPMAQAQTPEIRALQNYRRQMVVLLEEILFKFTERNATVVYATAQRLGDRNLFCGEALLGSSRQEFIINTSTWDVRMRPTRQQWNDAGCSNAAALVLADYR